MSQHQPPQGYGPPGHGPQSGYGQPSGYGPPPGYPQPQPTKPASHHSPVVLALSFLFCFPLGLVILWTNPKMPKTTKLAVTGVFGGIGVLAVIVTLVGADKATTATTTAEPSASVATPLASGTVEHPVAPTTSALDTQPQVPKTALDSWVLQATPVADFKIDTDESWALLPPGTTDCAVDVDGKIVRLDKPQSSNEFDDARQEQKREAIKAKYIGRLVGFGEKDIDVQFPSRYEFTTKTLRVEVGINVTPPWPFGSKDPTFRRQTDTFDTEQKIGKLGGKDLTVTGEQALITFDNVPTTFTVHVEPEQAEHWKNGGGKVQATLVQRFLGLGFHKFCRNSCAHILGTTQCSNDNVGAGEYGRAEVIGYRIAIDDVIVVEKQPTAPPPSPGK